MARQCECAREALTERFGTTSMAHSVRLCGLLVHGKANRSDLDEVPRRRNDLSTTDTGFTIPIRGGGSAAIPVGERGVEICPVCFESAASVVDKLGLAE